MTEEQLSFRITVLDHTCYFCCCRFFFFSFVCVCVCVVVVVVVVVLGAKEGGGYYLEER